MTASGTPDRARFLHIQQYLIATVYPFLSSLFLHTLRPAEAQDAQFVENGKAKFRTVLGPTLESFISQNDEGGDYLLGGTKPSAIDFILAKPLGNAASLGLLNDGFEKLKKILDLVQARTSYCCAYGNVCPAPEVVEGLTCITDETRTLVLVPSIA